MPAGAFVAKVTRIGNQTVQFMAGPRYYLESTDGGPDGLGFRAMVVLLYPR